MDNNNIKCNHYGDNLECKGEKTNIESFFKLNKNNNTNFSNNIEYKYEIPYEFRNDIKFIEGIIPKNKSKARIIKK